MSAGSSSRLEIDEAVHPPVYGRVRTYVVDEEDEDGPDGVTVCKSSKTIVLNSEPKKEFTFEDVFDPKFSTQADVYEAVAQPLVEDFLKGFNCTVFAYGASKSGKSYTMEGVPSHNLCPTELTAHAGFQERALHQILSEVDPALTEVTISVLGIHNERLFDYLESKRYQDRVDMIIFEDLPADGYLAVFDLEHAVVKTKQEACSVLARLANVRNELEEELFGFSSEAHTIFTITLSTRNTVDESMRISMLNLVDLAGSINVDFLQLPNVMDFASNRGNRSLSTLTKVIAALGDKLPHVPHSESILTRLLKDSLGGKSRTSFIVTVSPAQKCLEQSRCTLEFSVLAQKFKTNPEANAWLQKAKLLKSFSEKRVQCRQGLDRATLAANEPRSPTKKISPEKRELRRDLASLVLFLQKQSQEILQFFQDTQQAVVNRGDRSRSARSKKGQASTARARSRSAKDK